MKVKIEEQGKLSGKFICYFHADDDQTYSLKFDLENWTDIKSNGLFGGSYIQILIPEIMHFMFNIEYDLDTEIARKVYKTLVEHGWEVN